MQIDRVTIRLPGEAEAALRAAVKEVLVSSGRKLRIPFLHQVFGPEFDSVRFKKQKAWVLREVRQQYAGAGKEPPATKTISNGAAVAALAQITKGGETAVLKRINDALKS